MTSAVPSTVCPIGWSPQRTVAMWSCTSSSGESLCMLISSSTTCRSESISSAFITECRAMSITMSMSRSR